MQQKAGRDRLAVTSVYIPEPGLAVPPRLLPAPGQSRPTQPVSRLVWLALSPLVKTQVVDVRVGPERGVGMERKQKQAGQCQRALHVLGGWVCTPPGLGEGTPAMS